MTPQQLADNYLNSLKVVGGNEFNSIPKAFIKGYEANHAEFLKFINQTDLSEKDKNLVKGVYYDFSS